jgi:hypothetical protein
MPELWHQDVPNRKEHLVYKKRMKGGRFFLPPLSFRIPTPHPPQTDRNLSLEVYPLQEKPLLRVSLMFRRQDGISA